MRVRRYPVREATAVRKPVKAALVAKARREQGARAVS